MTQAGDRPSGQSESQLASLETKVSACPPLGDKTGPVSAAEPKAEAKLAPPSLAVRSSQEPRSVAAPKANALQGQAEAAVFNKVPAPKGTDSPRAPRSTATRVMNVRPKKIREITFSYAIRSYMGHLEGTQKSEHTIRNYRLDLLAFQRFVETELGEQNRQLSSIGTAELVRFRESLRVKGLRANTRRRKVLTVRAFLKYLIKRRQAPVETGKEIGAPERIERVPLTTAAGPLREKIAALPSETVLDVRNKLLFSLLLETAALVSEVALLRWANWSPLAELEGPAGSRSGVVPAAWVQVEGKNPRRIPVSDELRRQVDQFYRRLKPLANSPEEEYLFVGYNRFGPLKRPISARAVELLVREYSGRLAVERLTPKTFRQSRVVEWFLEGVDEAEIQRRLGLRTAYAFRSYEPILKNRTQTQS